MTRELRRDVMLPLVILMAILVVVIAGTVALLGRMAPAIERIFSENVYSLEAASDMLAVVASQADDIDSRSARFEAALARAEGNVTEDSERPRLATLREVGPGALAGQPEARRRAVEALVELGAINRAAVVQRDEEAKRIGYAGAWAAVFLGALSFAWALIAVRRARRRLIDPLQEISAVLDAAHSGDSYRRCRRMPAPSEVAKIMGGLDELLDARALRGFSEQPPLRTVVDRQILVHLLEQRPGPVWVVTRDGVVDAANTAGLAALAGDRGDEIARKLTDAAAGETGTDLQLEAIDGADRFLCDLSHSDLPPPGA